VDAFHRIRRLPSIAEGAGFLALGAPSMMTNMEST
jgi:hypothetical protein